VGVKVGSQEVERFNLGQRIVAVVALGAVLLLVGSYFTSPVPFTGWTGYAPLTAVPLARLYAARDGLAPVANLFVWFGLVLAWGGGSLLLLRGELHRRRAPGGPADTSPRGTGD
jgi:heme/copper-type cytochrome/quinol oxidase subunit 1